MNSRFEGLGRRFLAALLDNLTWAIAFVWLLAPIGVSLADADPAVGGVYFLLVFSAWFNYFALSEWRWGQTIGKNALGMRVISTDRTKLTFGQASVRNLLRLVDFFGIGWVMIAATRLHQRLGDKAAKTVVVREAHAEQKHYTTPDRAAAASPALATPVGSSPPSGAPGVAAATGSGPAPASAPPGGGPPAPSSKMVGLPPIGWDLSRTGWGILIGLLAAVFAPALVLPFDPQLDTDGGTLAAQALFGAALIMVAVGVASQWRFAPLRRTLSSLGLRRVRPSGFGLAILAWLAYLGAAFVVALLLSALFGADTQQEDIAGELGVDDPSLLVVISALVLLVAVAPLSEELFFRGMVFAGLRTRLSLWPAALASGAIFGLPHVPTGPLAALLLVIFGAALAWLYERTGSLWPCIFLHTLNNSIAVAVTA
jgi:uncharacterized protein